MIKVPFNKIKAVVFGMLVLGIFSSCEKVVETKPYSQFTTDNFFNTVEEANMATLGVYDIMQNAATYNWYIPLVYSTDNDAEYLSPGTTEEWRIISHYLYLPSTSTLYSTWSLFYSGIDRANLVIDRIPQMALYTSGTPADKANLNKILGEAKFLRGFYYSELVRLWGDVPFKIKNSVAGDNFQVPLTDRYVIYAQIIKDMQEAIDVLPATLATNERITKFGAKAMLARVALFAGGYSLKADGTMGRPANYQDYYRIAQTQVNDVIASGLYQLNPSYSQVFKNQSSQIFEPKENLFESSYYTATNTVSNSSSIGFFNTPTTAAGLYGTSLNRVFIPLPFYRSFDSTDLRRDFSVAKYTIDANGNRVPITVPNVDQGYTPGKWTREYQKITTAERTYTNINTVIMRYSDVLLMKAEIENELNNGPTTAAYDAINTVRRRAFNTNGTGSSINLTINNGGTGYGTATSTFISITGGGGTDASALVATTGTGGVITSLNILNRGGGYTSAPVVTVTGAGTGASITATLLPKVTNAQVELPAGLSKDQFLQRIQDERSWELCFEGHRRADLIRWNLLGDKIAATAVACRAIRTNHAYLPTADNFKRGQHELYPYPQNERDVNRAITRQNPGF